MRLSWLTADARAAGPVDKKPAEAKSPDPKAPPPAEVPPATPTEQPISQAERSVLLELRQRREELDARETALRRRESLLAAAQQKLTERAEEMRALQSRLESLNRERRKLGDQSWQGLVKLYETMKPREAAAILAAMDPDRARQVTQELARLRTRTSPAAAPPQPPAAKSASQG